MLAESAVQQDTCVSIIMPAYNCASTIEKAIESVKAQSFSSWQLLIVDDASTDATADVIRRLADADSRISYHCVKENSGSPAVPRNVGLDWAAGTHIAFMDADDVWLPAKLEEQLQFMAAHNLDLCGSGAILIDAQDNNIGQRQPAAQVNYALLLSCNRFVCSTVLCKASTLEGRRFRRVGHEDYAMWLELARDGYAMAVQQKLLACYRIHAGSISANKLKVIPYFWHIYFNLEGFSRARAVILTARYLFLAFWRARRELASTLKI